MIVKIGKPSKKYKSLDPNPENPVLIHFAVLGKIMNPPIDARAYIVKRAESGDPYHCVGCGRDVVHYDATLVRFRLQFDFLVDINGGWSFGIENHPICDNCANRSPEAVNLRIVEGLLRNWPYAVIAPGVYSGYWHPNEEVRFFVLKRGRNK